MGAVPVFSSGERAPIIEKELPDGTGDLIRDVAPNDAAGYAL
jgi:hypothetical protein